MLFRDTMRNLVKLTDTNLNQIAWDLGYENSYISKWYNGRKLPAAKSIEEVCEQLVAFFAENLTEEGEKRLITYYPHMLDVVHKHGYKNVIQSLLSGAYELSVKQRNISTKNTNPRMVSWIECFSRDGTMDLAALFQSRWRWD